MSPCCRTPRLILLVFILGMTMCAAPGVTRHEAPEGIVTVPLWQPHDFSFPATLSAAENPFLVPFSATLTGPQDTSITFPGFYDGDGIWKIRASPTLPGTWKLTTQSTHVALARRVITFQCTAAHPRRRHGPLLIDPAHPKHFQYADGTHCYLQSYECDWLWALELGTQATGATGRFLDKIASFGFNEVVLNAVAYDTVWRRGNTAPDDFGPPKMNAWEGTRDRPDHTRFNLKYWQHFDEVIAMLGRRGMQAHVLIKAGNKKVTWPRPGSAEDDLYFRWLISRYGACPNITWDLTKEGYKIKSLASKKNRLRFIRDNDGYHRLLTLHDDDKPTTAGAYDGLIDFLTDQQHDRFHETVRAQHARRAWPVLNAEFCYEQGPGGAMDKTYQIAQPARDTAMAAWDIAMAGGYATYYYTYTAWDIIRPLDTPPGYTYFKNLGNFFRSTHYWALTCADDLVDHGWCLANPGKEYVVYQKQGLPFTLKVQGTSAPLHAKWFNPFTGKSLDAGILSEGFVTLTPPPAWGSGPVALHAAVR